MERHSIRATCRKTHVWIVIGVLLLTTSAALAQADRTDLLERAAGLRNEDPESALQLLDRALADALPEQLDEDELATVADLLGLRAAILRGRGRYEAAAADARRLVELAERSNDPGQMANAAFLQGSIEAEQGQFAAALDRFHTARRSLEEMDRPLELARMYNAIGLTHNFTGDQARAREYFERAVAAAGEAGDDRAGATYLGNLALTVAGLEGPESALPMLREVLRLGEETGAQTTATMARANLCDQLVLLDEKDEAETTCLAALEEVDRMGEARWQAGIRLALGNRELEKALDHINDLARHDSLTGLFNRRALEELGEREVKRQQRCGEPLSVMLMDVDRFKSINDRHGHTVGDEALQGLAAILRQNLRETDLVGRWGGEEFLCILPGTNLADAERSARRIRSALETVPVLTSSESVRLTLTTGIAAVSGRLDVAIQRADQAMYSGKREGRDTIVVAEPDSSGDAPGAP